jgi:protein SCO1/2
MRRSASLLAALLATLVGACRSRTVERDASAVAAPVAAVSDYSLYDLPSRWRDQHGDTLHLAALAGRVRIAAMVYTSCHASCPIVVAELKRIEASLPADRLDDAGFVLVSIDPERDTPGRLAEWAEHVGLDAKRWTLLAGDDDAVRELAATLDVRYQAQPDGELAHTNAITVLDREGHVAWRQSGLGDARATIAAVSDLLR